MTYKDVRSVFGDLHLCLSELFDGGFIPVNFILGMIQVSIHDCEIVNQ